jgi:hypothetical protein
MSNKRRRTDDHETHVAPGSPSRISQLRLSAELATKLGTRYCNEEELVPLMLSHNICSHVSTFEVKATLMGDLNKWMSIPLDGEHASPADLKEGVERVNGIRPATQELFRYDETWTGTKSSGGSGHSDAQEEAAFIEEEFVFEGPCSVMVSVNEAYDLLLEGVPEDEVRYSVSEGTVFVRMEGKEVNGKGVWQKLEVERQQPNCDFLYFTLGPGTENTLGGWIVGTRDDMELGAPRGIMFVASAATTPDQITEVWRTQSHNLTKLRFRVCSSIGKYAALQRMEQELTVALCKEEAVAQQQEQEGRTVFRRVRGVAVETINPESHRQQLGEVAVNHTVVFGVWSTVAAPSAKTGVGSKGFFEFEVLKLAHNEFGGSCPQAGFVSDHFDLTIDGYSATGVGDDAYRYRLCSAS